MSKREGTKETARTAARAAAEASWTQTRVILRVIIIILAVAVTIWIFVKLTQLILLLILAVFFAYLVAPLVEVLRQPVNIKGRDRALPRIAAISIAYLIMIGALVIALNFVVPRLLSQFPVFAEQARGYWRTLGAKTQGVSEYLRLHRLPDPVLDALKNIAGTAAETASGILQSLVGALVYLPWLILIPVLSFFLLKDAETLRRSALQMLPRGRWRWRGDEFFNDISSTLAAYVRAQLTACLFIGIVCSIGFAVLGLPSPLVLGFIAGVFEFVPLVGPLTIAVVAATVAAFSGGFFSAFMVLLFLGILRVVQDYVVYPRLIGHGIHLHPLAVIIAILAGAELAGAAGIFLAIPAVAILTVSYRHWLEHRGSEGFADLLESSTDPNESPDEGPVEHPSISTTPEEMARARPDLTTGELKMSDKL